MYCVGTCACQNCFNNDAHANTVLASRKQIELRNPIAFAPKVIRTSDPLPNYYDEVMSTPASARHKRGCNCRKSSCQKKYCECYQSGAGCSGNCRCESCKNLFGTKDGNHGSDRVAQQDDDEEEAEKAVKKKKPSTFSATPRHHTRMLEQPLFLSKGKAPRSSFPAAGSASGIRARKKPGKPNHLNPPVHKLQRNDQAGQDDIEIAEMLLSNEGPDSNIGSSSSRRST